MRPLTLLVGRNTCRYVTTPPGRASVPQGSDICRVTRGTGQSRAQDIYNVATTTTSILVQVPLQVGTHFNIPGDSTEAVRSGSPAASYASKLGINITSTLVVSLIQVLVINQVPRGQLTFVVGAASPSGPSLAHQGQCLQSQPPLRPHLPRCPLRLLHP